jgi:hypothetical protein
MLEQGDDISEILAHHDRASVVINTGGIVEVNGGVFTHYNGMLLSDIGRIDVVPSPSSPPPLVSLPPGFTEAPELVSLRS